MRSRFLFRSLPLAAVLLAGCGKPAFDPLAAARANRTTLANREAVVPSQCYTKTDGAANPCWTCHTGANGRNAMNDAELQARYAFSEIGSTNHWTNLFEDLRPDVARITDAAALRYVREDNTAALRLALKDRADYYGYKPDIDYTKGFDERGWARDGSGWRAFRYKPFPGTFWPTNGATDDVLIRLPAAFRRDAKGADSRAVYAANLAIVEAAVGVADTVSDLALTRAIEPVDEAAAGLDLDGDGRSGTATRIRGLPAHYAGGAADVPVQRFLYPLGTEFIHTVRYLDPDAPNLMSARIRELRYAVKRLPLDQRAIDKAYREEARDKTFNALPYFPGTPDVGFLNDFGWLYQGFIEDAAGRLRVQTTEEQVFCMGCHNSIGVTVDSSFGLPRKVPGAPGWGWQSVAGMADVPQAGQRRPETLVYFERVGGGDEFRSNAEIRARFFPQSKLDEAAVRRAAPGGDRDLGWLINPGRERALALDKAIMARVARQRYEFGRDVLLAPAVNVHRHVDNGSTGLEEKGRVYADGRLWLEWDTEADANDTAR